MTTTYIPTNAKGYRLGEAHQNSRLSDREVELMRQLHETGTTTRELAEKFEVGIRHVRKIVSYRQRNQTAEAFRRA